VAVNTTQDADKITDVLRKSRPGGAVAFYDAIYMACTSRTLVHGEPFEPRRVLIVIGDGHDTASKKISYEQVLELAKRNLVTIYAISTSRSASVIHPRASWSGSRERPAATSSTR